VCGVEVRLIWVDPKYILAIDLRPYQVSSLHGVKLITGSTLPFVINSVTCTYRHDEMDNDDDDDIYNNNVK
jgi:hypothetical protein